ncbi:MAG: type II secretion system F family protein [Actinomycetota bacterium]|nr:type II secretion system F family protein [Actinomycetota bacterium]
MNPVLMLLLAVLCFVAAGSVAWFALGGDATGTALSLALIEQQTALVSEVGRNELPVRERLLVPLLRATKGLGTRLSRDGARARLVRQLDLAGNPPGWTADRVLGAKGAGLLIGAVIAILVGGLSVHGALFVLVGGTAGFLLPNLLVYNQGTKRQEKLGHGLAEALDMLTVCVEAGLAFDAALMQVARAVEGPIAGEFGRVLAEIQMGRGRGAAFSALRVRTTVPELHSFVSAIVAADRLGLPVGAVLREQAREMRLVRRQKAEEMAQKVPVKILFPMLLFIFPALFIVVMGPGAIRMIAAFSQ